MNEVAFYSLVVRDGSPVVSQCIQSIRSLRRYNSAISIYVFLYGTPPDEIVAEAVRSHFDLQLLDTYEACMQRAHPKGMILALYPTFHKFLSLRYAQLNHASQILYLDCDTFFFDDVKKLFREYQKCDWYAREEPKSRSSYLGYDPRHISEKHFDALAQSEKIKPIAPFNSGVCILNHQIWKRLDELTDVYLDLAWRLMVGRQVTATRWNTEEEKIRNVVLASLTSSDRARALDYPSRNHWIVEQIALWLTLGHIPDFSLGILSRQDVMQNGECLNVAASPAPCVVAHYFSGLMGAFFMRFHQIDGE